MVDMINRTLRRGRQYWSRIIFALGATGGGFELPVSFGC